ncbi:hypothetical protein MOV08_32675 [Streptomyces yunnanensis]|uniref:Uncharacterized protein n=1 Tax=Streptomyces yunnanensis TaxID=156453 RepID=A0ABY8AFN4_9ACTN|nr:hypothetical protein [Streptomyces yunnanensis]WEB43564.1 hypothetical protein MOV08_32675 [Streptomyces yunnanensis]
MSVARAATGRRTSGGNSQALEALGEDAAPLRCAGEKDTSRCGGGANEEKQ